jgi:NAD+ kinase
LEISSCVVAIKQTALAQGGRAAHFARRGDATARRLIHADRAHARTLDAVRAALTRRAVRFTEAPVQSLTAARRREIAQADLVLSVGGDGTALAASHYVRGGALLGVNSAPGDSVGHFCHATRSDFSRKLDDILNGRWKPARLARLGVTLDGAPLPEFALNDVLIAHECPAATTRYIIADGGGGGGIDVEDNVAEEEQRSSGLWVSTAAGSTAGIRSAGGRVMPRFSRRLQYLVRELYREPGRSYQLTRGFVGPGAQLVVASKMPQGRLYVDGAKTAYPFTFGMRAVMKLAPSDLRIFISESSRARSGE